MAEQPRVVLEEHVSLSESTLWKAQRDFYRQCGLEAWIQSVVPHHVTTNPFIAGAYARVVFGFLRDCRAVSEESGSDDFAPLDPNQPLYLVELGAGAGRFAYLFLKHLLSVYRKSFLRTVPITYVMTDFAERNIGFWRSHPSLQPLVQEGFLDFARFDLEQDDELQLIHSRKLLSPQTVRNPIILLANYVLDAIPADPFHIRDGQLFECRVTTTAIEPLDEPIDPKVLKSIQITTEHQPITSDYYADPVWNAIMERYRRRLSNTTILFPRVALQCLQRFAAIAAGRLLFLSADKGHIREDSLLNQEGIDLAFHGGSFSLMVNYHAVGQDVLMRGGQMLETPFRHAGLGISAFLLGTHPDGYIETCQAFDEVIGRHNPDDFYALRRAIDQNRDSFSVEQVLAYLRLSGWDHHVVLSFFPLLVQQAQSISDTLKQELCRAFHQVWETYYSIGERNNLAYHLGTLLCEMQYFPDALTYFAYSLEGFGEDAATRYSMAFCHYRLRRLDRALQDIERALQLDAEFEPARDMRVRIESELRACAAEVP
jgi:hypothetical protein